MMQSNQNKIKELQRDFWHLLCLVTAAGGEQTTQAMIVLRIKYAKILGEKDPAA